MDNRENVRKESKKAVLIIIPAYNEEKNIVPLLEKLEQPEITQFADVLVMNDASQDKTNHVTKKRNHTVITHVFNLGYGSGVREIPAVMHVRTTGVSMHSGLKPVLYMFRMTFSILAVWIREKILKMDEDKIHELEKYDE